MNLKDFKSLALAAMAATLSATESVQASHLQDESIFLKASVEVNQQVICGRTIWEDGTCGGYRPRKYDSQRNA